MIGSITFNPVAVIGKVKAVGNFQIKFRIFVFPAERHNRLNFSLARIIQVLKIFMRHIQTGINYGNNRSFAFIVEFADGRINLADSLRRCHNRIKEFSFGNFSNSAVKL